MFRILVGVVAYLACMLGIVKLSLGQLIKRQFIHAAYDNGYKEKIWGYLYQPLDHSKKYPTIIFFHGAGETGNTESSVEKLLVHGPLKFIKEGWKPEFNIIALQSWSWTVQSSIQFNALLRDDVLKSVVDTSQLIITGLSAGGSEVSRWLAADYPVKAIVPMSPVDFTNFNRTDIAFWGFGENNDMAAVKPALTKFLQKIPGRITYYPGNHCCWNTVYNPAWQQAGKSIYDWMDSVLHKNEVTIEEKVIVFYADNNNVIKVDTNCTLILSPDRNYIIEYRLSQGEIIKPYTRFISIYDFKNHTLPFKLPE